MLVKVFDELLKAIVSPDNVRGTGLIHILSDFLQDSILMLLDVKGKIQSWSTVISNLKNHHQ
jgi:hypothetical protein